MTVINVSVGSSRKHSFLRFGSFLKSSQVESSIVVKAVSKSNDLIDGFTRKFNFFVFEPISLELWLLIFKCFKLRSPFIIVINEDSVETPSNVKSFNVDFQAIKKSENSGSVTAQYLIVSFFNGIEFIFGKMQVVLSGAINSKVNSSKWDCWPMNLLTILMGPDLVKSEVKSNAYKVEWIDNFLKFWTVANFFKIWIGRKKLMTIKFLWFKWLLYLNVGIIFIYDFKWFEIFQFPYSIINFEITMNFDIDQFKVAEVSKIIHCFVQIFMNWNFM